MPRRPRSHTDSDELSALLNQLSETGPNSLPLHARFDLLQQARTHVPDGSPIIDRFLLFEIDDLREGLGDARRHQSELRELHERLTCPPWFVGVFLRPVEATGTKVIVAYQGTPRVLTLAEGVGVESLSAGDDVLLSHDLNLVIRRLSPRVTRASDIAEFQHLLADGRLVLKTRESEVTAEAASDLDTRSLMLGDRVRWDPGVALAYERLPPPAGAHLFLAEMPTESFADIGGLDQQVERLQRSVRLHRQHPDIVRRYQLRRALSVLLVGPPGTGKTMVARALARWLGDISPSGRCRFIHIKPGALHSMWFSQSEANYREAFRIAREAGASEPDVPVIMFFDEVESIGMTRGQGLGSHIDDRVMTSFMAELDGLEARGNVLVVGATNRPDALDPALLRPGRLGDLVLEIPRPAMAAARAILERHLPRSLPYGGEDQEAGRREVIGVALARLYAPNAEGDVASIMFRDGSRRAVHARELVSGAMLANIARLAIEQACVRELETGEVGVTPADLIDVVAEQVATAVSALTPANCHAHISGLPQDLAVVRVEPASRRARRAHGSVRVA